MKKKDGLFDHLDFIYDEDNAVDLHQKINEVINEYKDLIQTRGAEITFNQNLDSSIKCNSDYLRIPQAG